MAPKMAPKSIQKLIKIGSIFKFISFEVLELFRCLLGGFLGPPRLSWTALDPQNLKKPICFL